MISLRIFASRNTSSWSSSFFYCIGARFEYSKSIKDVWEVPAGHKPLVQRTAQNQWCPLPNAILKCICLNDQMYLSKFVHVFVKTWKHSKAKNHCTSYTWYLSFCWHQHHFQLKIWQHAKSGFLAPKKHQKHGNSWYFDTRLKLTPAPHVVQVTNIWYGTPPTPSKLCNAMQKKDILSLCFEMYFHICDI